MRKRFGRKEVVVRKKLGCEEEILPTRKIFLQQANKGPTQPADEGEAMSQDKSVSWLWNMNMM